MKIPCKDCITLPICRSLADNFSTHHESRFDLIYTLRKKCSLIVSYGNINEAGETITNGYYIHKMVQIVEYLQKKDKT